MAFFNKNKKKQDLSEGEGFDELEESEEEKEVEDEEDEEITSIKKAVVKNTQPLQQNLQQRKKELEQTERFSAFHNPEMTGIVDNMSGKPLAVDNLWVVLSEILNKLDRIEKSL